MFSQSIATSQQSRNGQIVSTWPNRLHTSHSACGQFFSEWPISSHVLHWWYGQSDALLVLCLLELQAEHSLSGQLASVCPCCSHKLQSSASGHFCSECPISSHVLHWWYGQSDDLLVLCRLELHAEHSLSGQLASLCPCCWHKLQSLSGQLASLCPCCSHKLQNVHSRAECHGPTVLQRGQVRLGHALLFRLWPTSLHTVQ